MHFYEYTNPNATKNIWMLRRLCANVGILGAVMFDTCDARTYLTCFNWVGGIYPLLHFVPARFMVWQLSHILLFLPIANKLNTVHLFSHPPNDASRNVLVMAWCSIVNGDHTKVMLERAY